MVPMDDAEVDVISSYINYTRDSGQLRSSSSDDDDSMIIEQESEEVSNGNLSILVVDTNFILSHLKVIDELKELGREFGLRIVIPVMVIRELDGLKNSSRVQDSRDRISGVSVGHLARWANDWIYNSLANNSDVVVGQKLRQRLDKDVVQDDAILDCCLYFKDRGDNLVVLLSNDKNLCTKALTNNVLTVTFKSGMSAKLIAKVIYDENINKFGKLSPVHTPTPPQPQKVQERVEILEPSREWVQSTQQVSSFQTFDEVSFKVYTEIQMILLSAIHHCMEIEYGEDLDLVRDYDKQSIVNIYDCSQILIRFWFTVFQQYFKSDATKFVPFEEEEPRSNGRRNSAKRNSIYVDVPKTSIELNSFIKFWTTCLKIIYDAVMDETQTIALDHLIKRWEKMASL
ncbi:Transcriptional protein SWT1 [Spathaspora sp. JA1]|nr:Transcriptional protein SWT1 [Spathaspora sp. JA1]